MIQRIQTVYLALTALCGLLLFFFPVLTLVPVAGVAEVSVYHLTVLGVKVITNGTEVNLMRFWPLVVLNVIIIAFTVFTLLQYKKRLKQIQFSHILLLLLLLQLVLLIFDAEKISDIAGEGYMFTFGVYSVLPVLHLIFTCLATGAIRKDEALVRSADRLR